MCGVFQHQQQSLLLTHLTSHQSVSVRERERESSIDNADAQAAQGCQQNPNNPWLASCVQSCSSVTDHKTLRITERIARQLRPSSEPGPRHPPRQAVTDKQRCENLAVLSTTTTHHNALRFRCVCVGECTADVNLCWCCPQTPCTTFSCLCCLQHTHQPSDLENAGCCVVARILWLLFPLSARGCVHPRSHTATTKIPKLLLGIVASSQTCCWAESEIQN